MFNEPSHTDIRIHNIYLSFYYGPWEEENTKNYQNL